MTNGRSRQVPLRPKLQKFVDGRVRSGQYSSAADVVEAGLKLLAARERAFEAWKKDVRKKIDEGLAAARRGKVRDVEDVFAEMEAEEALFERRSKPRRKSA
jgi:antitoxin ParD1/3/4